MNGASSLRGAGGTTAGADEARSAARKDDRDRFDQALWIALGAPAAETAPRDASPAASPAGNRSGLGDGSTEFLKSTAPTPAEPHRGGAAPARGEMNGDPASDTRAARSITDGARASTEGGGEPESGNDGRNDAPTRNGVPVAPRADAERGGNAARPEGAVARVSGREASREGIRSAEVVYRTNSARPVSAPRTAESAPGAATAARVLEAQATRLLSENARGPRTLSVTFRDSKGAEGRILLSLRGKSLAATILSENRETVKRLESELGELQRALGERGFADPRVTVRQARPSEPAPAAERPREEADVERDGSKDEGREHPRRRARTDSDSERKLSEVMSR